MESKVSLVKMTKKVLTKVELAKAIINITTVFNDIKLSDTETNVLAYFMVYGVNLNTKNLIIKSEICKNMNNLKTVMVKLKKLEFIYKDDLNGKVYVNKNLSFTLTPSVGFYLKIDTE